VAVQLGLSEKEITRYYTEYWRLKGLYKLHSIYKELKGDLSPIRYFGYGISYSTSKKTSKQVEMLKHLSTLVPAFYMPP
jgi:hypothetical protein